MLDLAVAAGLSAHASKGPTSAPKTTSSKGEVSTPKKASGSAFGEMSPSDAKRYNQFWDDVAKGKTVDQRMGVESAIDKLLPSGKVPYEFGGYVPDPA